MFVLVSSHHVRLPQHGVCIQSSINLAITFSESHLMKHCTDLNVVKVQGSIFTFFHFLDSGLKLLKCFDFDF